MSAARPTPSTTPSASLLAQLDAELSRHAPFAQMQPAHRRRFIESAEQVYFAPDEVLLEPASGVVTHLLYVRKGGVCGEQRLGAPGPFAIEPGEVFPLSAVLGARPVTARYQSRGDTFCLRVPAAVVKELVASSAPLADFVNRRMLQLLELSQRALQGGFASRVAAEPSLDAPLSRFVRSEPLAVLPDTPLQQALRSMQARRVGSVLVVDVGGAVCGILTRHDMLDRVVLPQRSLLAPISEVMSSPVHTLDVGQRAHDAALLMSRQGVRHVPITQQGRVVDPASIRGPVRLRKPR